MTRLSAAEQGRVLAASPFLAEACAREPQWLAQDEFAAPYAVGQLAAVVAARCEATLDEAALMRELRRLRQREMARIAFRDLAGLAPLDETLRDLSDLADACCQAAVAWSFRRLTQLHGTPRDEQGQPVQPVVLGMGKLGGHELNFSSDIDLIFCYTAAGDTDGERALSNEQFFNKLVQDLTKLLAARTEDGFVFRVDWMLRPFGSAGPPAISFGAAEHYYQVHGREWERYAMIKARPIAGDLAAGEVLLKTLRPFVYRRYLDFNAVGALRELKRLIEDEVRRKNLHDNLKLGDGGIREVEFIVQAVQLIRSGQNPRLRDNRLRPVLRYLGESGILEAEVATRLDEAYVFLRRAENAVQMYGDQQTHAIPSGEAERAALCAALQIPDWNTFTDQLSAVRRFVREQFMRVFGQDPEPAQNSELQALLVSYWHDNIDAAALKQALLAQGFAPQPLPLIEALDALRRSRLARAMNETATARLLELLGLLGAEALQQGDPVSAALRALRIVHEITGRSTYLTLLRESGVARAQLVKLCAASPWLTDLLAKSPALLDGLLNPGALARPPSRDEMRDELAALCAQLGPEDTEAGMDILRRYQKETTLKVAAADLLHDLPLVKVSDHLTWLAEIIVQQALALAWAEMRAQYGQPLRADGTPAVFGVIAYGKFGGIEMSYGSDLDLVFLHDCDALDGDTAGGRTMLTGGQFMARLSQRLISWLSTHTGAGRAYEVDMELRPDGRRGMSASSLAGFASYQNNNAWTWEHQALTRARYVAGDAGLGEAFVKLREQVLMRERDPDKLKAEIANMRQKMRDNLDKSGSGKWDIKQGAGGMIDIEFITQYLVLRDGARDRKIVYWSDNWRQLDALEAAGSVTSAQKADLIEIYRKYRGWAHVRGLQNENALAEDGLGHRLFGSERETIRAIWQEHLGGAS